MPILKPEKDLHPLDLFEQELEQRQWWVLYTRSRREKDLMRRLVKLDIAFYCPIIEKRHRSPNGRLRKTQIPLFSNYVFLCGNNDDRYQAMSTGCISRDLEVIDPDRLVHDLRGIHDLIEVGVEITPEPHVEVGTPVRVRSGVFENREGIVIERRGKRRLLVSVDFLQQGASVELEDCDIERI